MKKTVLLITALIITFILAACGEKAAPKQEATTEAKTEQSEQDANVTTDTETRFANYTDEGNPYEYTNSEGIVIKYPVSYGEGTVWQLIEASAFGNKFYVTMSANEDKTQFRVDYSFAGKGDVYGFGKGKNGIYNITDDPSGFASQSFPGYSSNITDDWKPLSEWKEQ